MCFPDSLDQSHLLVDLMIGFAFNLVTLRGLVFSFSQNWQYALELNTQPVLICSHIMNCMSICENKYLTCFLRSYGRVTHIWYRLLE